MHKILQEIKKELKEIEQTGLNAGNLDAVDKMVDIYKDIVEIVEMEGEKMRDYEMYGARARDSRGRYMEGRGGYNERGYNEDRGGYNDDHGRGGYGRGGNFINIDPRMMERLDRIWDGADMYQYGRDRYRGGDSEERMYDGLEKLMYAVCTFVESTMDFAETPQEKEIIRKHIQKLAKL